MTRRRELLDAAGVAALVVAGGGRDPHLAPFVGGARLHSALLVLPAASPPRLAYLTPIERLEAARSGLDLITPEQLDMSRLLRDDPSPAALWAGILERSLQRCGLSPGRLAVAGHAGAGALIEAGARLMADGWSLIDGAPIVERLRRSKDAAALAEVRRAAAGAGRALHRVAALLRAAAVRGGALFTAGRPLTVGRVRAAIAVSLAADGLEQPEGNIVAAAEEGAVPHTVGDDARALRAGESLIVDLFPRDRLFADCTRTFCVGAPPPALARAHQAVEAALHLARAAVAPGVLGWDLQQRVCDHFEAAGYATTREDPSVTVGYVHGLGHGVGWEVHEPPAFHQHAAGEDSRLAAGDVITLEPGLYHPDQGWAVRLEDLFALTDGGLENLTPLPYALDPAAWPAPAAGSR